MIRYLLWLREKSHEQEKSKGPRLFPVPSTNKLKNHFKKTVFCYIIKLKFLFILDFKAFALDFHFSGIRFTIPLYLTSVTP